MKKICMSLFLMLIPMTMFSYKITNSPLSCMVADVKVWNKLSRIRSFAIYRLQPGQSGAWNQNEIRKKLKVDSFTLEMNKGKIEPFRSTYVNIDKMPINANLEILIAKEPNGLFYGGIVDYSTGKVYNQQSIERAIEIVKKNCHTLQNIESVVKQTKSK